MIVCCPLLSIENSAHVCACAPLASILGMRSGGAIELIGATFGLSAVVLLLNPAVGVPSVVRSERCGSRAGDDGLHPVGDGQGDIGDAAEDIRGEIYWEKERRESMGQK